MRQILFVTLPEHARNFGMHCTVPCATRQLRETTHVVMTCELREYTHTLFVLRRAYVHSPFIGKLQSC